MNSGFSLLNSTIGKLKYTLDLGGEDKLPNRYQPENQIIQILSGIKRALRKSFKSKPNNEIEVQDNMETIFTTLGFNYDGETEQIPYSTKGYKPDFTFPDISLAVEAKLCNRSDREKEIIKEINDDIVAYSKRYRNLIFIIYDIGIIRDSAKFTSDLTENPNVVIEIIKH